MIIGITGGSGSGKTTFLKVLEEHGFTVLDCDKIYHQLLKTDRNLLGAINTRFPGVVENGILDRKKLGSFVFTHKEALAELNQISHNAVKAEVVARISACTSPVAIDAIGLFESGLNELCKLTVAVTAPAEARMQRLMARDNISEEYARTRIAAQRTEEEFQALCDYVLINDSTEEAFREKCLAFLMQQGIIKI